MSPTESSCGAAGLGRRRQARPWAGPRSGGIAFGETVAFLSSVIPAEAGIQRPKTRHSPLDSRLRGNDGNREVGELKCDCPASRGREQMMARSIEFPPSFVVFRPETSLTGVRRHG